MTDELLERRTRAAAFDLREIHPNVLFGTASDRYAGWIGQIYPERFTELIQSRSRKLGGRTFEERMLPVESVADYFEHFSVLEIDFTFYGPLLDASGEPLHAFHHLSQYAEQAPPDALFLLKAPQTYFARQFRRSRGGKVFYEENEAYLNAAACTDQFLRPAAELLQERLAGVLFEQEYQRVQEARSSEENIAELDGFFAGMPEGTPLHIELRSPHLLTPPYFDWLESRGIGFVFSHWTWLPQIREQWKLSGGRFTSADGNVICRLLTPLRTQYADAYALAHPFDAPVPEIVDTRQARDMVLDATALAFQAEQHDAQLSIIANNRAWGNAPALAQTIAGRILDEEEKRGEG